MLVWGNLASQFTSAQAEWWTSGSSCNPLMLVQAAANTGALGPACAIAGVPSPGGCPELAVPRDLHVAGCFLESIGMEIVVINIINIINVHTHAHIYIYLCRNIHAMRKKKKNKLLWSQTQNGTTYLTHLLLSFPQPQSLGCCWI